jgi:hypothetical protein
MLGAVNWIAIAKTRAKLSIYLSKESAIESQGCMKLDFTLHHCLVDSN